jgi:hypothetical protein
MPHSGVIQLVAGQLADQTSAEFARLLARLQHFKLWTHMSDAEVVDLLVQMAVKT